MNDHVQRKLASYPAAVRPKIERLRQLILEVAVDTNDVGVIEETLKWGELAYLTTQTKSGSTIRIDWKLKSPDQYALYVNCKTNLIDQFRSLFSTDLVYECNRAVIFKLADELPEDVVRICIRMALRYHLDKRN